MIRMARLLADCPTHICLLQRAGSAKLMSPNKDETAVYGCLKVLATPRGWSVCASVHNLVCIFT